MWRPGERRRQELAAVPVRASYVDKLKFSAEIQKHFLSSIVSGGFPFGTITLPQNRALAELDLLLPSLQRVLHNHYFAHLVASTNGVDNRHVLRVTENRMHAVEMWL